MRRLTSSLLSVAASTAFQACAPDDFIPDVDVPQLQDTATDTDTDVTDVADIIEGDALESLAIERVTPATGPSSGGNDVLIEGSGFMPGLEVQFGTTPASRVFVLSETRAVARPAPSTEPIVDIRVRRPGSDWVLWTGGRYVFISGVELHHLEPSQGQLKGGDTIDIHGARFEEGMRVFFGLSPAPRVELISETHLRVITPPHAFGATDVSVTTDLDQVVLNNGFHYVSAPRLYGLSPIAAAPGERIRLQATHITRDCSVSIGGRQALVTQVGGEGTWVEVEVPNPAPGSADLLQDVSLETSYGSSTLSQSFAYKPLMGDPYVLTCSHFGPKEVSPTGGETLTFACNGLQYPPVTLRIGQHTLLANDVDADEGFVRISAPPGQGELPITIANAVSPPLSVGTLHYKAPSPIELTTVSPARVPAYTESILTLQGRGFQTDMSIHIGGLPLEDLEVLSPTHARGRLPALPPQHATVYLQHEDHEASLVNALAIERDEVSVQLVAPSSVARSGGTQLVVLGSGFDESTTVWLAGQPLPLLERLGSHGLVVLSPEAAEGSYSLEIRQNGQTYRYPGLIHLYDPRGGSLGTWGDPIKGELNVSVWAVGGYGPVAGASVWVKTTTGLTLEGTTNSAGQVTLSHPDLRGPVEVWGSRKDFTAYSVHDLNSRNVTLQLQQNPLPPVIGNGSSGDGGTPSTPLPNATITGRVLGFDKYIVAPPGTCASLVDAQTGICTPCERTNPLNCGQSEAPELSSNLSCEVLPASDGVSTESRCLIACEDSGACPTGFACSGGRCYPAPAQKAAYCNISSTSIFGYENAIQPTAWVNAERRYMIDSLRLGEIAVYCIGGYRDHLNNFTASVLGVKRNLVVSSGELVQLDIDLAYPLDRTFKLRLQDPPTWPTGLSTPSIGISVDLGADGAIPFSRALLRGADHPNGERDVYWAPRQLAALTGDLQDTSYVFYTQLGPANNPGYQPRSYHLRRYVSAVAEDRLPVLTPQGAWDVSRLSLEQDIYSVLSLPGESIAAFAVGAQGSLYHLIGDAWHKQPPLGEGTLLALDGQSAEDVWVAGENGFIAQWNGQAWTKIAAPLDRYSALLVTEDAIYAAGDVRVRRFDRTTQTWDLWGAPSLQRVRAFVRDGEHLLAFGAGHQVARWHHQDAAPQLLTLPLQTVVRAGLRQASGDLVLVGDQGFVAYGPDLESLTLGMLGQADLTAVSEDPQHGLVVTGDFGEVWLGENVPSLSLFSPEGYQARLAGTALAADGALHVLGSRAFALGPFAHFPLLSAPDASKASDESIRLRWSATGKKPSYVRFQMISPSYVSEWTSLMTGYRNTVGLPIRFEQLGIHPLQAARFRLDVLSSLTPGFSIDDFTSQSFNTYIRESWATNELNLYLIP